MPRSLLLSAALAVVAAAALAQPRPDTFAVAAATAPSPALPEFFAVAAPVHGIAVDGDLSDWPPELPVLPVRNGFGVYGDTDLDGVDLAASADLSPSLRVGYDSAQQLLYVAVKVRDDELVNPAGGGARQSDACEVYVSGLAGEATQPLQYTMVPGRHTYPGAAGNPSLQGGAIGGTRTRGAWKRRGDVTTYEWRVQVFDRYPGQPTRLEPGKVIGFDAVVVDVDDDDSNAAWIPWGPAVGGKASSDDRVGRLVLGLESWAAGAGAAEARQLAAAWVRDHADQVEAWKAWQAERPARVEARPGESQERQAEAAVALAMRVARAAEQAAAVAAADAGNASLPDIDVPEPPELPAWVPWARVRSPFDLAIPFAGTCALILTTGLTVFLLRRSGRGQTQAADVEALAERIAHIESRLTDTQDVMIALSEKLDRIDAGRAGRSGER